METSDLALCVINDRKPYESFLHAWIDSRAAYCGFIERLVEYRARQNKCEFEVTYAPEDIARAIVEVIDYMDRHIAER